MPVRRGSYSLPCASSSRHWPVTGRLSQLPVISTTLLKENAEGSPYIPYFARLLERGRNGASGGGLSKLSDAGGRGNKAGEEKRGLAAATGCTPSAARKLEQRRSPLAWTGGPCSPKRTWAEKNGAQPLPMLLGTWAKRLRPRARILVQWSESI